MAIRDADEVIAREVLKRVKNKEATIQEIRGNS